MRGVSGPSTQMDIQGWRKWLRTPGPIRAQQKKQEAGMLKLLLGHWKAHRKKPSLLPEDGDVHFEDPTRINPIFEDSDSSISSTKRVTDSPIEENQTVSRVENEQTENESVINELIDVSVPTHSKDLVISDSAVPEDKTTDAKNDNNSSVTQDISQPGNSEIKEPSVKLNPNNVEDVSVCPLESKTENVTSTSSLELTSSSHDESIDNTTAKSDKDSAEVNTEEKMRLYNQPSTSAIRENKNSFPDTTVKDLTKSPILKSSDSQNNNTVINKEPTSKQNKPDKLENIVHPSSPLKRIRQNSPPSVQTDQPDKPAKLRAKAIQELIKKFQGPSAESENVIEVTKTDSTEAAVENKHLPNNPPEAEVFSNKYLKKKDKSPSSPSTQLNEDVNKITKIAKEPLPKPKETSLETVSPIKNDQKVEALSNIFKFPPPPPLEPLPNESNLHGKILKERKFNSQLTASNKRQEIIEKSDEIAAGKTRSDSSLDRTKTASSNKSKEDKETSEKDSQKQTISKIQEALLEEKFKTASVDRKSSTNDLPPKRNIKTSENTKEVTAEVKTMKQDKPSVSKIPNPEEKLSNKSNVEPKKPESELHTSNNSAFGKKESPVLTPKASSSFLHKNHTTSAETNAAKSTASKQKSSISKASLKQYPLNEKENIKSHSEDSGITRGDQISSETTQETTLPDNLPEETNSAQNPPRKTKKEKKLKPGSKKPCKHCRHAPHHNGSIGRSQYDEYYDGLTGIRHFYKGKHSDSWTSDLSWEEKELLRRLRSKKGTVRSNTPSTKSRHSRHRFIDERQFRRHHNYRRSVSDDSTFYGSSLCSCDECWAQYIRDYSYGRTSVRGMSPIQEVCTCHTAPQNFLGRRVQFRSDTIHESSQSKRTSRASTPAPPTQSSKQEDEADDKSSQMSSKTKDGDSVRTDPEINKEKKSKNSEEAYRFMTPWELEEWNLLMRKQLLQKRRRRARCMGLMALAMVVFIGLVVTILMVYLRRKVI